MSAKAVKGWLPGWTGLLFSSNHQANAYLLELLSDIYTVSLLSQSIFFRVTGLRDVRWSWMFSDRSLYG